MPLDASEVFVRRDVLTPVCAIRPTGNHEQGRDDAKDEDEEDDHAGSVPFLAYRAVPFFAYYVEKQLPGAKNGKNPTQLSKTVWDLSYQGFSHLSQSKLAGFALRSRASMTGRVRVLPGRWTPSLFSLAAIAEFFAFKRDPVPPERDAPFLDIGRTSHGDN